MLRGCSRWICGGLAMILSVTILFPGQAFAAEAKKKDNAGDTQRLPQTWMVAQDGTGQFSTISEAVAQAEEGDTIWIFPGIYEESVQMADKELQLVGVDPRLCIIQNCREDYFNPPLEVAAGKVSNLTIYAYRGDVAPIGSASTSVKAMEELGTEIVQDVSAVYAGAIPLEAFTGYAVHIENRYSYGRTLTFENCIFKSDCNYAVGAGLRGEFTLTFKGCEFLARGSAGDIYLHDNIGEYGGETNVIFEDTLFKTELAPYFLSTYSVSPENRVNLTFRNARLDVIAYQDKEIYSVTNLYTGLTADQLPDQIVERLTPNRTLSFLTAARSMENPDQYKSGRHSVTYLWDTTLLRTMSWEQAIEAKYKESAQFADRTRALINVWNLDGQVGPAWCGTMNFYLTPDSMFNEYPDFNYVPPVEIVGEPIEGEETICVTQDLPD